MELYKKYRPKTLKNVAGNQAVVKTLTNMLEKNTLPHTLLFHGPSGCGKTTLARILVKSLECSEVDFKELNCSDNRGVDTIREIIRTMSLAPTGGKVRIWLMDEVHMLTPEAQDASLKMLEDTPRHCFFFLCTTDPQKLKKTVKGRCTHFQVEPLSNDALGKLMFRILKMEGHSIEKDTLLDIAEASGGSVRQALVILDSILNLPPEEREEAIKAAPEEKEVLDLCQALIKGQSWTSVAKILKELKTDPESVRYAVLGYARAVLLNGGNKKAALIIDAFADNFYDSKQAGLALACYEVIVGL